MLSILLFISSHLISCESIMATPADSLIWIHHESEQKVDLLMNDQLLTSYFYSNEIEKPVLYPVNTTTGVPLTRGFPYQLRPGERVDHPHHLGFWLNYGDVNGLDFWNNSSAIPEEKKSEYGFIKHQSIKKMESAKGIALLEIEALWLNQANEALLEETTIFTFRKEESGYSIERQTTLSALEQKVLFEDNKEGMIAIRVRRELEHPSDKPIILTDSKGNPTEVPQMDNSQVTGNYLSSEGVEGVDVWGKRAQWMQLSGEVDDEKVSLILMDHPKNPGYPTYWHARGYGLFAANPLGQSIFSEGKEALHFSLAPKEETTFTYKFFVINGYDLTAAEIDQMHQAFIK